MTNLAAIGQSRLTGWLTWGAGAGGVSNYEKLVKEKKSVKPDFDNVAKLYCDALNGLIREDDKQIVDGRCMKVYGQQPGVLGLD